ncbi:response regulator transcription factor [uncultured Metabacillus sp.]|uniref:response regulator transcription factor n=1 Tax=uncultured Metabacillus sp. TaxID=2860135 RepID=UPI00260E7F12|nr:response regulator transcription factor [uncultured Metabacillus sp.]
MSDLCKVVIVDDELLIRQGIKHYIQWEQEGFQIVGEASNGQEALQVIDAVRPHIVITDIVMPVMDGEELTKVIRNQYPDIEVIVLSSFGEFDYVRSTFQHGVTDYILKPTLDGDILLKTLNKAVEKIPSLTIKKQTNEISVQAMLDKWMTGFEGDGEETAVIEAFPYSYYLIIGVDVKKRESSWPSLEKTITDELEKHVTEFVRYPLPTEDGYNTLLINVNEENIPSVIAFMERVAASYTHFNWAVSNPFKAVQEVKQVYDNSFVRLMNHAFYYPEKNFFRYEGIKEQPSVNEPFNLTAFTEMFKREQFEKAMDYLQSHVSDITTTNSMNVAEFKRFLSNVIFNITLLLNNMGFDSSTVNQKKFAYFTAIEGADHVDEAVDQLQQFLAEVTTIVGQPSNNDPSVKRILDYIEEHYAEPLTLTELAKQFHFNPTYLSTYFSTHIHEGFTEYVTKVRIEKSLELLHNRNISISDISGKVGYSDHSYFCKVFKKLKGMSPSSYRKQFVK